MLENYAVTDMDCFDDYLDSVPRAKIMRGNGITAFILQISLCITFNKKNVTGTFIAEASLKSFYSRLGFKVIKYFMTYPNFEEAHKRFRHETGIYIAL